MKKKGKKNTKRDNHLRKKIIFEKTNNNQRTVTKLKFNNMNIFRKGVK